MPPLQTSNEEEEDILPNIKEEEVFQNINEKECIPQESEVAGRAQEEGESELAGRAQEEGADKEPRHPGAALCQARTQR